MSDQDYNAKTGWICPKCMSGVRPDIAICPCSSVVALQKSDEKTVLMEIPTAFAGQRHGSVTLES